MKHIFQHILGFLRRWVLEIDPEKEIGVAQERRHQEHVDVLAVQAPLRCKNERTNHGATHRVEPVRPAHI